MKAEIYARNRRSRCGGRIIWASMVFRKKPGIGVPGGFSAGTLLPALLMRCLQTVEKITAEIVVIRMPAEQHFIGKLSQCREKGFLMLFSDLADDKSVIRSGAFVQHQETGTYLTAEKQGEGQIVGNIGIDITMGKK